MLVCCFRGNIPETGGQFVLNDVLKAMREQSDLSNTTNQSAKFYNFTLLSEFTIEDRYFDQHQNIGKLLHENVDGIAIRALFHGVKGLGNAIDRYDH